MQRSRLVLAGKFTATLAIAIMLLTSRSGSGNAAPPSVLGPALGAACDLHCHACSATTHYTHYDAMNIFGGVEHSVCQPGGCYGVHSCDPELENAGAISIAKALDALRTGSQGSVDVLASKYPKTIAINRQFHAVQLKDCKGQVVAHIPMSDPGIAVAAVETH